MYACPGPGGPDSLSFGSLFFVRPEKGLVFSRKYPASHPMSRFESQKARDYIWPNLLGTFESFVDIRCQGAKPERHWDGGWNPWRPYHWVIHWGAVQLVKSGPISPLHYRKYRILYNIIPWNSKTSTSKLHGQYPISILACFVLGWARQWFETCWNDQMRGVSQISPGQPHLYYSKPPKR